MWFSVFFSFTKSNVESIYWRFSGLFKIFKAKNTLKYVEYENYEAGKCNDNNNNNSKLKWINAIQVVNSDL